MAEAYERLWRSVERQFVGAAEEMPEDKYSYAPSQGEFKGVRTFAEQARHVAAVNYMIFASMMGEKAPANVNQGNGPAEMKSKAELMKYLRDSFDLGRRAFAALNDKNAVEPIDGPFGNKTTRVTMATLAVGHAFDHYGQMVVYLRMNGIVPPASRPRQ